LYAAKLMGQDISGVRPEDAGEVLSGAILDLMPKVSMSNGLGAVGYGSDTVYNLV